MVINKDPQKESSNGEETPQERKKREMLASGDWREGDQGELIRVKTIREQLPVGLPSKERIRELETLNRPMTEAEAREYALASFDPSSPMNILFSLVAGAGFDPVGEAAMRVLKGGAGAVKSILPKSASKAAASKADDVIVTGVDKELDYLDKPNKVYSPEEMEKYNINERGYPKWTDEMSEAEERSWQLAALEDDLLEEQTRDRAAIETLRNITDSVEELMSTEGKSNLLDFETRGLIDGISEFFGSPHRTGRVGESTLKDLATYFRVMDKKPLNVEGAFPNTQIVTRTPNQYFMRNKTGGVLPKFKLLKNK